MSNELITITIKLKKEAIKKWSEADSEILRKIIHKIKANIVLKHPNYKEVFRLYTDASDNGLASILLQKHRVIGIFSKKYNTSEKNYSVVEKECLAIIKSVMHFKPIVFGTELIINNDNRNITFTKTLESSRIHRWKIIFEEFNYKFELIKRKNNIAADYFSRNLLITENDKNEKEELLEILKDQFKLTEMTPQEVNKRELSYYHTADIFITQENKLYIPNKELTNILKFLHRYFIHPRENKLYYTINKK